MKTNLHSVLSDIQNVSCLVPHSSSTLIISKLEIKILLKKKNIRREIYWVKLLQKVQTHILQHEKLT